jgi:hypothetical protein
VGDRKFRAEMKAAAKERGAELERFAGLEAPLAQQERRELWEERLGALAAAAGLDLGQLGARKSAPNKVLLAAAMKHSSSVSNGWLATRLAMGQPASVSQFVRRWLFEPEKRRKIEALLSRVKT